jgi:hypothetical protein
METDDNGWNIPTNTYPSFPLTWLGLQLRVLVVRDPCAVCRADARLSAQHFHHCDVVINLTYSSYYHHSFR